MSRSGGGSPGSHRSGSGHFQQRSSPPNQSPNKKQAEYNNQLYKTELCKSFTESGYCRYGLKCRFAHGQEDLRPVQRHKKYKTEICKNFAGSCPYGSRCRFIHQDDPEDLVARARSRSASSSKRASSSQGPSTPTDSPSPTPSENGSSFLSSLLGAPLGDAAIASSAPSSAPRHKRHSSGNLIESARVSDLFSPTGTRATRTHSWHPSSRSPRSSSPPASASSSASFTPERSKALMRRRDRSASVSKIGSIDGVSPLPLFPPRRVSSSQPASPRLKGVYRPAPLKSITGFSPATKAVGEGSVASLAEGRSASSSPITVSLGSPLPLYVPVNLESIEHSLPGSVSGSALTSPDIPMDNQSLFPDFPYSSSGLDGVPEELGVLSPEQAAALASIGEGLMDGYIDLKSGPVHALPGMGIVPPHPSVDHPIDSVSISSASVGSQEITPPRDSPLSEQSSVGWASSSIASISSRGSLEPSSIDRIRTISDHAAFSPIEIDQLTTPSPGDSKLLSSGWSSETPFESKSSSLFSTVPFSSVSKNMNGNGGSPQRFSNSLSIDVGKRLPLGSSLSQVSPSMGPSPLGGPSPMGPSPALAPIGAKAFQAGLGRLEPSPLFAFPEGPLSPDPTTVQPELFQESQAEGENNLLNLKSPQMSENIKRLPVFAFLSEDEEISREFAKLQVPLESNHCSALTTTVESGRVS